VASASPPPPATPPTATTPATTATTPPTADGRRGPARLGRLLASPVGVLVTLPAIVIAAGLGILLVGRDATRTASESMARSQLIEQAQRIEADVALALDQAGPLLVRLRALADPARPTEDALVHMHDLLVARPGVSYVSISFPDGTFRGAYLPHGERRIEVQESRITALGTEVSRFTVESGALVPLRQEVTSYDPRKRDFYTLAAAARARAWTNPYPFFGSHETGITCTEPVLAGAELRAVLTVDFEVGALSSFVARPGLPQARSLVFTKSGVILAYPAADRLALPAAEKLLRREDLRDPGVDALLAEPPAGEQRFVELSAKDGGYLASVAPIGGKRADVAVPLDWYVATLVPEHTLLGPMRALQRWSLWVSAGALVFAVGLSLVLAWNLVRMRRQVARSREQARSAEERARELGAYRLIAKLGAGGMGEVWRAEHRLLARSAAIKLIRPEALSEPAYSGEVRERFRREAQTLASMRSRHTIELYDYGVTEDGTFYYVMELLEGLDQESLVASYGAQPAARVIDLMIQACASLAEAHDAGLLHRDIKPPNLYLCRAADEVDIVKLLDFGIVHDAREPAPLEKMREVIDPATSGSKLTRIGAMLGTPGFMAPEQILGMQLDGRADIYALGCCAWWLLAGGEVFDRRGAEGKILNDHIYTPVPSLRARVRGFCPVELEEVIAACLAKEIDRRPANARELATRLRAIPIPPEHAWTPEHAQAWWSRYQQPEAPPAELAAEVQEIMPAPTVRGSAAKRRGASGPPPAQVGEAALAATVAPPKRSRR
jgi:serine/threonine protein kinase